MLYIIYYKICYIFENVFLMFARICFIIICIIHGQRSLAGYSAWGHEELDTAEVT